jgi:hypothetical protein
VIVEAGTPITAGYKRGETLVAAQNAVGAFPAAADIRTLPGQENKKIVVFRATRKAAESYSAVEDTLAPRIDSKKVAVPAAAQKAIETLLAVADAGEPIMRIGWWRETPCGRPEGGQHVPGGSRHLGVLQKR